MARFGSAHVARTMLSKRRPRPEPQFHGLLPAEGIRRKRILRPLAVREHPHEQPAGVRLPGRVHRQSEERVHLKHQLPDPGKAMYDWLGGH